MTEKVSEIACFVDYRLHILGIRVSEHSCQLIAKQGQGWVMVGPRLELPVHAPRNAHEAKEAEAVPLLVTAYQYILEHPGTDLPEVLNGRKSVSRALVPLVKPTRGGTSAKPVAKTS